MHLDGYGRLCAGMVLLAVLVSAAMFAMTARAGGQEFNFLGVQLSDSEQEVLQSPVFLRGKTELVTLPSPDPTRADRVLAVPAPTDYGNVELQVGIKDGEVMWVTAWVALEEWTPQHLDRWLSTSFPPADWPQGINQQGQQVSVETWAEGPQGQMPYATVTWSTPGAD